MPVWGNHAAWHLASEPYVAVTGQALLDLGSLPTGAELSRLPLSGYASGDSHSHSLASRWKPHTRVSWCPFHKLGAAVMGKNLISWLLPHPS